MKKPGKCPRCGRILFRVNGLIPAHKRPPTGLGPAPFTGPGDPWCDGVDTRGLTDADQG